jgi:hypothetical protein
MAPNLLFCFYLKGTTNLGITYNKNGNPNLEAFSDSDWGTLVKDKRLSRTGVILCFAGGAINWISKKQKCTTLSSTEAEYVLREKILEQ